ncbi:MAG TPA: APC family permease [Ktedonobacterales bacterium]|jgi:amino acid transporter
MSDVSPQASQPAVAVAAEESSQLGKGRLRVWDAVGQSVGLLALIMALAITTGPIAAFAGPAAPLAYLIAGLGSLCLAYVFIRFTRSMASAGSIYTYVSKGLGPEAGFMGGWLYAGAFTFGVSFTLAIASFYTSVFMSEQFNNDFTGDWFWIFLIGIVLLFLFAFFDIRFSTRTQLVVTAVGVVAVLIVVFAILFQGGAGGLTIHPFSPNAVSGGLSSLFVAVIFGFTAFGGFEAAATLGEESVDPRRAIPRAILVSILVAVVFFVLTTYAFAVGYGADDKGALKWAVDAAPLDTLAAQYVNPTLAKIIDVLVAIDAFIASLAGLNLASRVLFAMGRDRGLPAVFGRSHSRFKSPWVGIIFALVITIILGALPGQQMDSLGGLPLPKPLPFAFFLAGTATLGILGAYLLAAISGLGFFQREKGGGLHIIWQVLLPLIAVLIVGATLISSFAPLPPAPPLAAPLSYAPYIFGAWLLLGLLLVVVVRNVNPAQVSKFGQIVAGAGEESQEGAPAAGD